MEEIRSCHILKNALKYELIKSIPITSRERAFKSLRNKNYSKFYLEYMNLYPQCENLSINLKNENNISSLNKLMLIIRNTMPNLKNISSLTINFRSNINLNKSEEFNDEFKLLTEFISNLTQQISQFKFKFRK